MSIRNLGVNSFMNAPYRLFLTGITSAGNDHNLRVMIEPIGEFFHGLIWTFHHPIDDGAAYLESRKGDGRIVYVHFSQRHGSSMTQFLHQGPMQQGDFFVNLDSMERLSPSFCAVRLPGLIKLMRETDTAMIANYGKGLIYRYSETLEFRGSPHWYATGLDGRAINIELDETEFYNVRGQQRDPFQFVTHYLKYYLYPAGSNHCLLGLEKNGDPNVLFPPREARRLAFRQVLRARDVELTVDGVKSLMAAGLDDEIKGFFRAEKVLNDAWRHLHLGRTDFPDDHDFTNVVEIP